MEKRRIRKYKVTKDADMLAPDWLADRINYKTVKILYGIHDGAKILKGVKVNDQTARIGDTICFDGRRLLVERR